MSKTNTNGTGRVKGKNRTAARAKGPDATARCEELDLTAAAWAAVIRAKVMELASEMGRIDNLRSHPDTPPAAVELLFAKIDRNALGKLMAAIEDAERAVEGLFLADALDEVPRLAGACRAAAAALDATAAGTA